MNMNVNDTPKAEFNALTELGFSVIPIPRGQKAPAQSWADYQTKKPSADEIDCWASADLNVGVVTGRLSNIGVLDVDSDEAQKLVDGLGLPETPTVLTAKGRHYYFRCPEFEVRNSTKIAGVKLDFRGEGGYVIGAGSLHPDGSFYRWEVSPDDVEFAELPENLITLLKSDKPKASAHLTTKAVAPFVEAGLASTFLNMQLQNALATVGQCVEGGRNDTLFKEAARIANHVAAIGIDWLQIAPLFEAAGLSAGLGPDECKTTVASAWAKGSLTPTPWLYVASNWIFVGSRDKFWSPKTKEELSAAAFSMTFADRMPTVNGERAKGRLANFLTQAGVIERVIDLRFDPTKSTGIFESSGEKFFNRYQAPNIVTCNGDCTVLTEFLAYLVPNNEERAHLERMIAWTVRNPGRKLGHALLLQSKAQGIGKTTLIDIWRALLGYENTRKTNSEEMASNFQSYMSDALLVVLEELNLGNGMTVYNKLKDLITGDTAILNEKYIRQKEVRNMANFVFLSNLDAPLLIEQEDRRFFVIDSPAEKRDEAFWSQFHSWWRSNLGVIKGYFDCVDISTFQPNAPPPDTDAKDRLKQQSQTPLVQELRALVTEERWPFTGDIFTLDELQMAMRQRNFRRETPAKLTLVLKELGCVSLGQLRMSGNYKQSLWACRNTVRWREALPEELRTEYRRKSDTLTANDNSGQ